MKATYAKQNSTTHHLSQNSSSSPRIPKDSTSKNPVSTQTMMSQYLSLHPQPSNVLTHSLLPSNSRTTNTILTQTFHLSPTITYPKITHQKCSKLVAMASSTQPQLNQEFDDFEPDPTLTNDDLKPTSRNERSFSGSEMASLWVGLVVGVPTYYLAGSLVDLGMSWWQGISTVVAANIILLVPLVLTGQPGTRYGISFPVLARSSFGIHGAHIPTLIRALVGCGWYGIETWIGGEAIFLLLPKAVKDSSFSKEMPFLGTSLLEFGCFLVFWIAQLGIVWKGMDGIRKLEKYAAPILIALTSCLLIWSYVRGGGFGHMLELSSKLSATEFWILFFPSLTANISFWATVALNIPDFTRYAKSQRDQIVGHIGLPVFMGAFTFVGLAVTSSTKVIFGEVVSNPIQLLGMIGGWGTKILAIFGISLATITTNIAANVVAPANALVNLSPSKFSFRKGAILTALLGIAFQPWRLLKSSESFVYTWLVGYSALVGPIGGIILADYYLVQRGELNVKELYTKNSHGTYYYSGGYNLVALLALVVGIAPMVPGFLEKIGVLSSIPGSFRIIYNNAWFISFFLAGGVHWIVSFLNGKWQNLHHVDHHLATS